jgi:hypothetical protein
MGMRKRLRALQPFPLTMARLPEKQFQRTFGRTPQTKVLDHVWHHRDGGINIKELSKAIRNSYVYTVNIVNDLAEKELVVKVPVGRESIVRPNARNPVIRSIAK